MRRSSFLLFYFFSSTIVVGCSHSQDKTVTSVSNPNLIKVQSEGTQVFSNSTTSNHSKSPQDTVPDWINAVASAPSSIPGYRTDRLDSDITSMVLYLFDKNEVKAIYVDNSCDSKYYLEGSIKDKVLTLTQYSNGKICGNFIGRIVKDRSPDNHPYVPCFPFYFGTPTDNVTGLTKSFKITVEVQPGFMLKVMGHDTTGRDNEQETFIKKVKNAVLNGDKEWFADHVKYPFYFGVDDAAPRGIKMSNKQELIKNFDKYFTPAFKETAQGICPYGNVMHDKGIDIGTMWVTNNMSGEWYILSIFFPDAYLKADTVPRRSKK